MNVRVVVRVRPLLPIDKKQLSRLKKESRKDTKSRSRYARRSPLSSARAAATSATTPDSRATFTASPGAARFVPCANALSARASLC